MQWQFAQEIVIKKVNLTSWNSKPDKTYTTSINKGVVIFALPEFLTQKCTVTHILVLVLVKYERE
jgi:hypothetical protein